ncbi:Shedu immune nuclease family protein [Xanthobacter autotrophicus]|uniref:Shedu immune nuclease family protein n=1 Tax=Xanthobacter autotrophicus TaxID=280 RepID=UPI0037266223
MPYLDVDGSLVERFKGVLNSPAPAGRQKEQVVQDFLEEHTELIPTPNLLNHHLQLEAVVSKFQLSTALITDYVYLTKSSGRWLVTFVELESPDKPIFTSNLKKAVPSAPFTEALAQVVSWKTYVNNHKNEVIDRLKLLFVPPVMRRNPVSFEYYLIIGRSENKNKHVDRLEYLEELRNNQNIHVMSYDSLLNEYATTSRYRKNVMRFSGNQLVYKRMLPRLPHILAHLGPADLLFTSDQEQSLIKAGYDIDEWKKGKPLIVNGMYAKDSEEPFNLSATIAKNTES